METLTHGRIAACVQAIGKLHESLRLLYFIWDGMNTNPRAPLSYIDKSQNSLKTSSPRNNPIGSFNSMTISSLILSGIVFFANISPT